MDSSKVAHLARLDGSVRAIRRSQRARFAYGFAFLICPRYSAIRRTGNPVPGMLVLIAESQCRAMKHSC